MHIFADHWNGRLSQFVYYLRKLDKIVNGYLLLIIYIAFVLSTLAAAKIFVPDEIRDFGFADYAKSLATTGEWKYCTAEYCDYATRMPLLVLIHTVMYLYSVSPLTMAYAQIVGLALATLALYIYLFRLYIQSGEGTKTTWFVLSLIITLFGVSAKHASQIAYEEGVTIWLLVPLSLSIALLPSRAATKDRNFGILCGVTCLLAIILYLAKSSMTLVALVGVGYVLNLGLRQRSKLAVFLAVVALTAPITWGIFVKAHTDRFSIMTSLDGENFFRGWNAESVDVYPLVSLDREFDSSKIVLPNGREVAISPKPLRENFGTEWECNDYYRNMGLNFIRREPLQSLKFLFYKLYVYSIYIMKSPVSYGIEVRATRTALDNHVRAANNLIVPLWLLTGRIAQAFLAGLCIFVWTRLKALREEASILFLLNVAYAAPYIAGFSYERHVTASIVLASGGIMALCPLVMRGLLESRARWRGSPANC
jgi:hypothetical protein